MYSTILLNGAIPLPLAIIINGLVGAINVDWELFILSVFGIAFKKLLVKPTFIVDMHKSMYSSFGFHEANV